MLPSRAASVQDLTDLEDTTGLSGEIDLIVNAGDVTRPEVVAWLGEIRTKILMHAGYAAKDPSCLDAELCPGPSIPDFLPDGGIAMSGAQVRKALKSLPQEELKGIVAGGIREKKLRGHQDPVCDSHRFG